MNILVISGSPRKGGNTEIMVQAFADGARESGNAVKIMKMSSLKVAPCLDCEYCFSHDGTCSQHDDMSEILEAVDKADMLVFASPIYWSDVTAQIKAVVDRLYARAKIGFHPTCAALLLDSGSSEVCKGAVASYKDMVAYLKWKDKGVISVGNMTSKGAMSSSPRLTEVADFGRSIK